MKKNILENSRLFEFFEFRIIYIQTKFNHKNKKKIKKKNV